MSRGEGIGVHSLACAAALLLGFAPADVCGQRAAEVDSVYNDRPVLPADSWKVSPEPLLEIGRVGGAADLNVVRGAVRLPGTGTVVIANAGEAQLLYVRNNGEITRIGRRGGGPEEFEFVTDVGVLARDSVYVLDHARNSIVIIDGDGNFGRRINLGTVVTRGYFPRGVLGDGTFVLTSETALLGAPGGRSDSTDLVLLSSDGTPDTIARLPKTEMGDPVGSLAFGARSVLAVADDRLYWAYGEPFRISEMGRDGSLRRVITKVHEPYRLTERDRDQFIAGQLERFSSRQGDTRNLLRRARQEWENSTFAASLPAIAAMRISAGGQVWVKEYELPGVTSTPWHVFSRRGCWITSVNLPDGFTLEQVGAGWVLGVSRGEWDEAIVTLLRLSKVDSISHPDACDGEPGDQ